MTICHKTQALRVSDLEYRLAVIVQVEFCQFVKTITQTLRKE